MAENYSKSLGLLLLNKLGPYPGVSALVTIPLSTPYFHVTPKGELSANILHVFAFCLQNTLHNDGSEHPSLSVL